MAIKGEDDGWFSSTNRDLPSNTDSISVRVSNFAQDIFKRQSSVAAGEMCTDGDDESSFCCFPRGRSTSRKGDSISSNLMDMGGARTPFSRLDADQVKERPLRSRSVGAACCCCGPRRSQKYTVEVRAVDLKNNGTTKQEFRTDGRWEIDVNEEYYKPSVWKQLMRKVKAHAKQVHSSRCEWLNYDPQSYEKNFDNGGWRDSFATAQHFDENDDLGTKERALHSALLHKFASSRSQQCPDSGNLSPILSPMPVKALSKEELDKSKQDFVPLWQRRAAPPLKLDLRQRTGSQGE